MSKSAVDILKEAILLERRGKAFYTMAAKQTESEAARKIFEMMAAEEEEHINFLSRQFAYYEKNKSFMKVGESADNDESTVMAILSEEIKSQVSAAGYEAAAISAAMDFETRAVQIYSERAASASDKNEQEMYQMLADWEKGHHFWLHKINEDLKEQVWYDNNFWPF
jgi:rubrerythrin